MTQLVRQGFEGEAIVTNVFVDPPESRLSARAPRHMGMTTRSCASAFCSRLSGAGARRRVAPGAMLALTMLAVACKAFPRVASVEATLTDSADIRLVRFARLPTGPGAVRLSSRPHLTLGGIQENDSLEFDARGVFLSATYLADGQIVVGDHHRLKYFDARGELVKIVGRDGNGPGEFSNIRDLCAVGDSSLVVFDHDGRWTVWDRSGSLRHAQARLGVMPFKGCSRDDAVIVRVSKENAYDSYGATKRRTLPYALYRTDGTLLQPLGRLAASEYYGPIFFEPSFGILADELLIAEPQRFEIRTQSLATGRVTNMWRVQGALRVLTDAVWDTLIASGFPSDATAEQRRKHISRMKQFAKPPAYPAFGRVRADPRGRIWINPYFDHLHWYVIDNDGARISLVSLLRVPKILTTCFPKILATLK